MQNVILLLNIVLLLKLDSATAHLFVYCLKVDMLS